jgi:hypothetical protein
VSQVVCGIDMLGYGCVRCVPLGIAHFLLAFQLQKINKRLKRRRASYENLTIFNREKNVNFYPHQNFMGGLVNMQLNQKKINHPIEINN